MSIEAMKQALEALETEQALRHGYSYLGGVRIVSTADEAINALRTAIQQAESEPVAVRNPFASRCYTMSESHLSGHRLIVGFEKLEDAQSAHEWVARCGRSNPGELPGMWHESDLIGGETDIELFTHPAPGVPDDSKRLDYLQDRGATIDLIPGVAGFYPMKFRVGGLHSSANTDVRAAIDAASVLTSAQAQKAGER